MGTAFIPRAVLTALLVSLPWPEGGAQVSGSTTTGTISGSVADIQGGAIAGTRITIIEDSTGRNYDTTSDCSGLFRRSNLPAGGYRVRFEAEEFRPETRSSVQVRPSQVTQLEGRLQQVLVYYEGPQLTIENAQPTGAIHGTVVDSTGAAVPARITLTEKTSGTHHEGTTDSQGVYWQRYLPEGKYWLRFEAAGFDSDAGQVIVKASNVACSSVRLPEPREVVEVCTTACMIETSGATVPPAHPGIELQIYAPSTVVIAGSELLLTVTLTNTSTHPIFVHAAKSPGPTFGYQIHADGPCNCPGQMQLRWPLATNGSSGPIHRVAPGETLTDNISLRTPMDLPWPGTYTIVVARPDTSSEVNCCEEPRDPLLVRSNQIKVTVMAAR